MIFRPLSHRFGTTRRWSRPVCNRDAARSVDAHDAVTNRERAYGYVRIRTDLVSGLRQYVERRVEGQIDPSFVITHEPPIDDARRRDTQDVGVSAMTASAPVASSMASIGQAIGGALPRRGPGDRRGIRARE